jgi:DNA-binding CsgD family transcriptional regulator
VELNEQDYDAYLIHYGTPRHSGRYPWGSGDNPYQRNASFRSHILDLRKQGLSDAEIARGMGMSRTEMIAKLSKARAENRAADVAEVNRLKDKGYSNSAIGRRMGINESQVRNLLKEEIQERADKAATIAKTLADDLKENGGYLDVGLGSEQYLGVSKYTMENAVALLKEQGYEVHPLKLPQMGTHNKTTYQVLCPPGTEFGEAMKNRGAIRIINDKYSEDGGRSVLGLEKPVAIDPKRVKIRYADDVGPDGGKGIEKDGVIELRRGVNDISLGGANYAQVRINVGDSHYLKGMAVYSDNMPDGVDIIFNTNKHPDTPMMGDKDNTVLKPMKRDKETGEVDWDNPFGATIKGDGELKMAQRHYIDKDGKKQLSAVNIVNEEGDWETWSPTLSSQFLSKQKPAMARQQLKLVSDAKQAEFDEIISLTNPTVKKKLLNEFADECDSAAVHLKAAALPRQSSHVLLPVPGLKENEIFAPNYNHGEQVALVRHPHAGTFEIPLLTVNNKSEAASRVIGKNSPDAVGINAKVAAQLSGADFDGDTVLVIPTKGTMLQARKPLEGLKDFEPKDAYRAYPGMTRVGEGDGFHKQRQMGDISNLITDMTIKGAPESEITRAVKHSMVVIDAEKHNLDWRRSARENDIPALKEKYQGGANRGASTLISMAKGEVRNIPERKEIAPDKRTGERRYIPTNKSHPIIKNGEKTGEYAPNMTSSTRMFEEKDARKLSSGTTMENIYADHANRLKALANSARKEALATTSIPYSPAARKTYAKEVAELDARLNAVKANKPRERQANLIAGLVVSSKLQANPELKEDKDHVKKLRYQALKEARERTGAKKSDIVLTDRQWEAIQAGAIHKSKLEAILGSADADRVRELALPRSNKQTSPATISRIKAMRASGHTQAEIAESLGLSTTTVNEILRT